MLLARGVLLLLFSLTFNIVPDDNLLVLLIVLTVLLLYTIAFHVYKSRLVAIHEIALLGNLIILSGSKKLVTDHSVVVIASISLAMVQFFIVTVWNIAKPCFDKKKREYVNLDDASVDFVHDRF